MKTSERLQRVHPSRLLELIAKGHRLRGRGVDLVDLGPGQPDFPVPEPVLEATARALRDGFTFYSPVMGLPELREAVAHRYDRLYGGNYTAENVMITAGAKGALYHLLGALLDPGDEVIVPAPYYVSTPEIVKLWGGEPRFVPCRPKDRFLPRMEAIAGAVGPRTRAIVLNSPCNPTGAVVPRELLSEIVRFAQERGLFVLLDECYDRYVYVPDLYATAAHIDPLGRLPVLCAGSFSKTFSMTGYRLGWALGPAPVIAAAGKIQAHSMNGPTTFAQVGGIEALRLEEELFAPVLKEYARRRQALVEGLSRILGVVAEAPPGSFYVFPEVGGLLQRLRLPGSDALADLLLDRAGVMAVPGAALGQEGFLRVSFAVPVAKIEEATERIVRLVEEACSA